VRAGAVVVDLDEHPEPLLAGFELALGRRESLQVGGVFHGVRVELARELNLIDQRPDIQIGGLGARLPGVGARGHLGVRVPACAQRERREQGEYGERELARAA
jgi:hypothetical protein